MKEGVAVQVLVDERGWKIKDEIIVSTYLPLKKKEKKELMMKLGPIQICH